MALIQQYIDLNLCIELMGGALMTTNSNGDFLQCSRVLNYSNDDVTSLRAADSKSCQTKHDSTPFLHRSPLLLSTAFAALVYAGDGMQQVRAESVSSTGDLNAFPPEERSIGTLVAILSLAIRTSGPC